MQGSAVLRYAVASLRLVRYWRLQPLLSSIDLYTSSLLGRDGRSAEHIQAFSDCRGSGPEYRTERLHCPEF